MNDVWRERLREGRGVQLDSSTHAKHTMTYKLIQQAAQWEDRFSMFVSVNQELQPLS